MGHRDRGNYGRGRRSSYPSSSGSGRFRGGRWADGGTARFENDFEGAFDNDAYENAGSWRDASYPERHLGERGLPSNYGETGGRRRYRNYGGRSGAGPRYPGSYGTGRYTGSRYRDDFGGYGGDYTDRRRWETATSGARDYSLDYLENYPESERGYWTSEDDDRYRGSKRGWWDRASDEVASWFGDDEAARRRSMDDRGAEYDEPGYGSYRGRGPQGYTRSDDRIKEDINDRLTDHPYLDASNIDVEVSSGEVVLSGTVDRRHGKRLAEDIAERISGVKNVENRIRVNRSWSPYDKRSNESATSTMSSAETTTGTTGRAASSRS